MYTHCTMRYDQDGRIVWILGLAPDNNIYLRIAHPLLDPVLSGVVERLRRFINQTFWANAEVYMDKCLFGVSPGGTGQPMYCHFFAAMYGALHEFFDPNVWYHDEELAGRLAGHIAGHHTRAIRLLGHKAVRQRHDHLAGHSARLPSAQRSFVGLFCKKAPQRNRPVCTLGAGRGWPAVSQPDSCAEFPGLPPRTEFVLRPRVRGKPQGRCPATWREGQGAHAVRHTHRAAERQNPLASLLPNHVRFWWPLVEDMFASPACLRKEEDMTAAFVRYEEMEYVSIDATLRCTMPLLGQASEMV